MSFVKLVSEEDATGKVKEIYGEIKKKFGKVPNVFKAMAHFPDYLEAMWERQKIVMAPGHVGEICAGKSAAEIGALVKEIVTVAVSATRNCEY